MYSHTFDARSARRLHTGTGTMRYFYVFIYLLLIIITMCVCTFASSLERDVCCSTTRTSTTPTASVSCCMLCKHARTQTHESHTNATRSLYVFTCSSHLERTCRLTRTHRKHTSTHAAMTIMMALNLKNPLRLFFYALRTHRTEMHQRWLDKSARTSINSGPNRTRHVRQR